jgi:adenylate cyclase
MSTPGQDRVERRLAAILAADVVGYTRLMSRDEAGTHARLKAIRRELLDPSVKEHGGRVVKSTGDGALVEFPSAFEAVNSAIELQKAMRNLNAGVPEDKRIVFRLGLNVGDLIIDEGDIYGDGVNVAVRLEGLCPPGGICISRSIRDQVRDKLPYDFDDLGEQQVKNMQRPVRTFALTAETVSQLDSQAEEVTNPAKPRPALSIVVLPFANLSKEPDQDHFADGLTEDLTTDISRISGAFVIARNTAFTFKGKPVDVKQVGRDLGVRYALEGSVQRTGDKVRVNARLIDTETDGHIWADRIEGYVSKLADVQDEVTGRIARSLDLQLVEAEGRRAERSANPDAIDLTMRGQALARNARSREDHNAVLQVLAKALQIDPDEPLAHALVAAELAIVVLDRWFADPQEKKEMLARADVAASRAVNLSPGSALAHWARAHVLRAARSVEQAIVEYEAALAINPNMANARATLGISKLRLGRAEETIADVDGAIRLSPRDPSMSYWLYFKGAAYNCLGQPDAAIKWCQKSNALSPNYPWFNYIQLISAYGWKGDADNARAAIEQLLRLKPDYTITKWVNERGYYYEHYPRILEGLRKAGLPE